MGDGALAIGPKLPRPPSTLPQRSTFAMQQLVGFSAVKLTWHRTPPRAGFLATPAEILKRSDRPTHLFIAVPELVPRRPYLRLYPPVVRTRIRLPALAPEYKEALRLRAEPVGII